jgi:spermidine/putrescine transport system ATP-binding protein
MSLVAPEAAPPGTNSILARVVDVSFIGVSTHYLLRTSWGADLAVVVQNLDDERHAAGSSVAATWLPQHTFVVT